MTARVIQGNVGAVVNAGRFVKGVRASPATEFKKGQHWRPHKVFREKEYLLREYVRNKRSLADIATEHGVRHSAICHWLHRHGIPGRTVSETRKFKKWGSNGSANPMFGKRGPQVPSWKGGVTPERQAFYSSAEWLTVWRKTWNRDKKRCQRCRAKWVKGRKFDVHHIFGFEVRELRGTLSNLVLLCRSCHRWVHSNANTRRLFLGENA